MNELIKITTNDQQEATVSGRDLHTFLEVKTQYKDWFPRMVEYGFVEGEDFSSILSESTGGRPSTDHAIKLNMAKHLCMIQRTERGRLAREYFIAVEQEFNSPERLMARALKIADRTIASLTLNNKVLEQRVAELQPKATYYDLILQNPSLISVTEIAKDYGMSAKGLNKILCDERVQYKQSGVWFLYSKYQDKGYTHTKTTAFPRTDGSQGVSVHTYWTQKGRIFLYDLLKSIGILPMIERELTA